jgi:probable HAF family extracellular repeat protein
MRLATLAGVGWFSLLLAACDSVQNPTPPETQTVRLNIAGALRITMRDLETLGGDFSTATAINRWGIVVGYSRNAAGEMHAFRWDGTMHDLGTLGGNYSRAVDINDVGQIAGTARISAGAECEQGGPTASGCRAFRWDATTGMQPLPTLGGDFAAATDINQVGHIAGFSTTATGEKHAFYWDGTAIYDVGTLPLGDQSVAWAANDRGRVVGVSTTRAGPSEPLEFHAFVWDYLTKRIRDLGTLGGTTSQALAVNRRGEVAGYAYTSDEKRHAFFWDGWTMRDLGTLDPNDSQKESEGVAMNRWGDVVGSAEGPPFTGREHPFIWNASHGMRDLGTLGGPDGHALAINDLTEVVGDAGVDNSCSAPGGCNAFFWDGVMHDLGRLGDRDSEAVDLNTRGQIVGSSQTPDDDPIHPRETHAVLWTVRY